MPYPHGMFSWIDVSVPDPETAKPFYTGLFGWDAEDAHDPDGNYIYTMFSKGGKAAAGMAKMPPERAGMPSFWMSYATVDDLEATVAKWTAAGGSVLMPPFDVMTSGRMAVVADPEGAAMALWQAGDSVGGEVFNEHGALTWNELNTRDSAAARDFYGKAMGWEFEEFADAAPGGYWVIRLDAKEGGGAYRDDKNNGGVMTMDDNWPADVPPHWMVYFHVDDTDTAAAKVGDLGGTVAVPPFDTVAGRIAVVADNQGAHFSLIATPDEA